MRLLHIVLLAAITALPASGFSQTDPGWVPLFDGESLEGWTVLNGDAEYYVDNGEIVGVAKLDTPNTFLATEQIYGDFILEYEFKVDARLNSGVQIRSVSNPEYRDGRVHGYQVEIDPSDRAWTGGLYDEQRRGWLYPLTENPRAQGAFRQGEWNLVRVEAIGSSIRTWVNGQMAANLIDDMTLQGFIALQVHSIGDPSRAGAEIRWRRLRIRTDELEDARLSVDPTVPVIDSRSRSDR